MSVCSVGEILNEECHKTFYGSVSTSLKQLTSLDDINQKLLKLRVSNDISTICQYHFNKFVVHYNHKFGNYCSDPLKIHRKGITKDLREIKLENLSKISPANSNVCLIPGKSLCRNCHYKLFVVKPESVPNDGDEKDDDDEYQPSKGGRKPKPGKKRKGQDDDDDSDDDWNKKKPAKKGPAAGGRGGGGKKQSAFTKSFKLSPELADVVGSDVMPRHEVVKKLWAVIKERDLQDPKNKQYAICDDQLMKVFGIKRFRTFGMMKHLKDHFLEAA